MSIRIFNNKIFKESLFVFLLKIIGVGLGFVTNIIIARYYGAEILGEVSLINSFLIIASLFVLFGTNTAIIKLIPEYTEKYNITVAYNILKKTLKLVFLWSFVVSIILYLFSPIIANNIFHNENLLSYFQIISILIFFISVKELNLGALRGLHNIKIFAILNILQTLLIFVFLLIFTFSFYNIELPIYLNIFVPIIVSFISFYYVIKIFKNIDQQNIKIKERSFYIIKTSLPMFFISSMHIIMSQADIIMIGMFLSEKEVGIYTIAMKLALLTNFILNSVNSVVSSKFAKYFYNKDFEKLKTSLKVSTKIIIFTTLPIILFLIIFGKNILSIFGKEFISAYCVLVILLIGQIINVLAGAVGYFLNMTGNAIIYQRILIVSLVINLILNYFLIPMYGLQGAAIATTVSVIIWNILGILIIKYKFGFTTIL